MCWCVEKGLLTADTMSPTDIQQPKKKKLFLGNNFRYKYCVTSHGMDSFMLLLMKFIN